MNLDDFLKVIDGEFKEVDDVLKAHEHFQNLSNDGKYAFICSEIEAIADDEGKNSELVLSEIHELMTE